MRNLQYAPALSVMSNVAMFKQLLKFWLLIFYFDAMASDAPKTIKVTRENADALSIKLEKIDSGSPDISLYQLEFSKKLKSCVAGRVQTYLLSGKNQISGSSMDYMVGSENPSILFHMPTSGYDMSVIIQYCCSKGASSGCSKSISTESVKRILSP